MGVQAKVYNASGLARTRDHLLPVPPRAGLGKAWARQTEKSQAQPNINGRGAWKRSTPEFICRTGFAPGHVSLRTLCRDRGAASHARGCRFVVADIIMEKQKASMQELERQSKRHKLDFYITNNMFDDTKLFVWGLRPRPETAGCARGLWPGHMEVQRQRCHP